MLKLSTVCLADWPLTACQNFSVSEGVSLFSFKNDRSKISNDSRKDVGFLLGSDKRKCRKYGEIVIVYVYRHMRDKLPCTELN